MKLDIIDNGIKSKERVKKNGEVFTPMWLVKEMCDNVDECSPETPLSDPKTTVLEPAVGTGNFVAEILSRKLSKCKTWDDVLTSVKSIFAVDILEDNVLETRMRMLLLVLENNIILGDFLSEKTKEELEKAWERWNGEGN